MTDFQAQLLHALLAAATPEDFFGPTPLSPDELRFAYIAAVREVHPDHHGGLVLAHDAFKRLGELRVEAAKKIADRTWGVPTTPPVVLKGAADTYMTTAPAVAGDLCDVYEATSSAGVPVVVKVCRAPADRDLLDREAEVLKDLALGAAKALDPARLRYFPALVDAFDVQVGSARHRVNVLARNPEGVTLREIIVRGGPVPPVHVAWMWNRGLEALSWLHARGWVHGAVCPEHLLVTASDHGAVLLDECWAVRAGSPLVALAPAAAPYAAPELARKQQATAGADVLALAETMAEALGASDDYEPILAACRLVPHRRPDAYELHQTLKNHNRRLYGPPKFIPYEPPKGK